MGDCWLRNMSISLSIYMEQLWYLKNTQVTTQCFFLSCCEEVCKEEILYQLSPTDQERGPSEAHLSKVHIQIITKAKYSCECIQ